MKTFFLSGILSCLMGLQCAAGVSVVGTLTRTTKAKPGERFEGILLLRNNGDEACDVRVFQTDYLFFADGRNIYGEPGKVPRSNADWFTVSPSRVSIPKGEIVQVHYKGVVPDKSDLNGSYWSLVMVEPSAPPAPEVRAKEKQAALGLRTLIRFGVQVVTEVGQGGDNKLKILDKRISRKDGKRIFQLDVENDGIRLANPTVWVELYNQQGNAIGKFEAKPARIYPTCSARFNLDLSDVPIGNYSALAVVDNGDDHAVGGQYQLQIEK